MYEKIGFHGGVCPCPKAGFIFIAIIFSSPEPKAHGELIVYRSIRRPFVCASVRPSVNIFKHEYL